MTRLPNLQKVVDDLKEDIAGPYLEEDQCVFCQKKVSERDFRDPLSLEEWRIAQMCQACQDHMYGKQP